MLHYEVLKNFKEKTNINDDIITCWFQNGKNSVRVRLLNGAELVFTYTDEQHWKLETVAEFIKTMRGGKK